MTSAPAEPGPYEEFAYPGYAYPFTHPARVEVLGRLFGLTPAPAASSRVLELGCGDGANALAMAHTLPAARVIALDASPSSVARGRALRETAGIQNAELLTTDLGDLENIEALGPFDYIVAHGVYSWIPPGLRGALLECCRRYLSPHGIAYVSYNAYPGSYLRDMARDILTFHVRDVDEPGERIAKARELMTAIVTARDPSPFGRVLSEQLERMLGHSDALLYHDELAPVSTPFYFYEFIEHAAAHELQFLSEASLGDSQIRDVPESVGKLIAELPRDVVMREQYLDFLRNRMFRRTLLVRASAPVRRTIDPRLLDDLLISSPAEPVDNGFAIPDVGEVTTSDPRLKAALTDLCAAWPEAIAFSQLTAHMAERDIEPVRHAMLDFYIAGVVGLDTCPLPARRRSGERPVAGALARAQHAAGRRVLTTLLADNTVLDDPLERSLLPLLDGTRDREPLAVGLDASPDELDGALASLARRGLLGA